MFLILRNCGTILKNGKNKYSHIADKDRKALINHSHTYLQLKCTNITKPHVVQLAKTLVFSVPSLSDTPEGENAGFVCFTNSFSIFIYLNYFLFINQAVTLGFLDKKIRNQKYRNKEIKEAIKSLSVDENQVTPQRSSNVTKTPNRNSSAKGNRKSGANEMDIKSGLQFFKSVVKKNTEFFLS